MPRAAAPKRSAEPLADEAMHLRDIGRRRRQPGADRPDRLVGDHQVVRRRAVRQRAVELRADHVERAPGVALVLGLADADDRESAPRARRPAPWRGPARRFRRDRLRRSEWPTITAVAPASASISAEISPVKAPAGSAWQSCAPIATRSRAPARRTPRSASRAGRPAGRPAGDVGRALRSSGRARRPTP